MNIAILMDSFGIGGTELNTTRTLEALAKRGLTVQVLHFHADGPLRDRIAASGHHLTHIPIVPLSSPLIFMRIAALAGAFRRVNATLIHCQDVYANILGVAAGRYMARIPVITSRRWKDDVPRRQLRPLNAWAHRHSALVTPNSRALVPTLLAEGVSESRIALHENFVDDSAVAMLTPQETIAWRHRLSIPEGAPIIGCVARLSRVKRHELLLRAFALVVQRVPQAHLVIVGDGAERAPLTEQAHAMGLSGNVLFTGTLPNTPLPQQLFDVAVLLSENEGFPNALVEAALCGVPLVATMVGGVPDVLQDGITGLAVPAEPVESIADAITALLVNPTRAHQLGAAGRELVLSRFGESAAIERLLGLYRRVSRVA